MDPPRRGMSLFGQPLDPPLSDPIRQNEQVGEPVHVIGKTHAIHPVLVVWYNTKCPVCDAGIEWQKSRLVQAARAGAITFRDINLEPDALARFGVGIEEVRRWLHGVDSDGRLYVGAECAIEIWRRTPGTIWLAGALDMPVLRQIAGFTYNRFADGLYAWNRRKGHW